MSIDRLAIDASRSSPGAWTGTEWYSHEIIRAIAGLPDRPALTLYTRSADTFVPGRAVTHRFVEQHRLWTHLGLSRALRQDRPEALFVPSHVIPIVHLKASVVTVHDLGYLRERDAHPRRSRMMLDATTRWNARAAARIIAISGQTRDDLIQHYGVRPERVTVIHHGVDHERFRPLQAEQVNPVLDRLGVQAPYLLFVSTIQPRKNLPRIVAAFELQDDPELNLVIAGKPGWMSGPALERIAASPARERITLLGYVAAEDLPALYNGAQAFVFPSLYEGFGMGILEAMACGCPVVTSDRSSLPEVAGDAAVLADPTSTEAIAAGIRLALLPDRRAELVKAGIQRASGFTWERTARETMDVICNAV